MQPTNADPRRTQRPKHKPWRVAAYAAVAAVALAACSPARAGTRSTSASPSSTALGAPTTASPGPAPAARADVGIINFKFTPATLTVKVGTTVVWTNKDAIAHTVNITNGNINSKVLNQSDQFTYTFATAGTYNYICSIHPFMHGSVTVTA
jgi:amicyanin